MREIKTAEFDTWSCTWSCSPEGETTLRIGCQAHDLNRWQTADTEWITNLDPSAIAWWDKYGAILLALVVASPATPWGSPASTEAEVAA